MSVKLNISSSVGPALGPFFFFLSFLGFFPSASSLAAFSSSAFFLSSSIFLISSSVLGVFF